MSNEPGGRASDQVLSGNWGVESIALSGGNGLQAAIHGQREGEREREREARAGTKGRGRRGRGWRRRRGGGGAMEMRVAAPFFTGDKNIFWDINLELRSSLPLLPRHPSSFY